MTDHERRASSIPRQVPHSCSKCGGNAPVLNGAYFRDLRVRAHLTLREMARIASTMGRNVTLAYLSRMELGEAPFGPKYAALYERLFERRRKAGDYVDED